MRYKHCLGNMWNIPHCVPTDLRTFNVTGPRKNCFAAEYCTAVRLSVVLMLRVVYTRVWVKCESELQQRLDNADTITVTAGRQKQLTIPTETLTREHASTCSRGYIWVTQKHNMWQACVTQPAKSHITFSLLYPAVLPGASNRYNMHSERKDVAVDEVISTHISFRYVRLPIIFCALAGYRDDNPLQTSLQSTPHIPSNSAGNVWFTNP